MTVLYGVAGAFLLIVGVLLVVASFFGGVPDEALFVGIGLISGGLPLLIAAEIISLLVDIRYNLRIIRDNSEEKQAPDNGKSP